MRNICRTVSCLGLAGLFAVCMGCSVTHLYKHVTVETNPDGTTKKIEEEKVTQTVETVNRLKLDRIKMN